LVAARSAILVKGASVADEVGVRRAASETAAPEIDGEEFTDAELTALALAADPDRPLDADAVPLDLHLEEPRVAMPHWYMPPVMARRGKPWRTAVVLAIVVAFLVIEAVGLCSTYGQIVRV
jgi:hypothetical protein